MLQLCMTGRRISADAIERPMPVARYVFCGGGVLLALHFIADAFCLAWPPRAGSAASRSRLDGFSEPVKAASVQLMANPGRPAELVQSFKQAAADQQHFNRRSFNPGELGEQVLSRAARLFRTRRHQGATGPGLHIVYNIVAERPGGRVKPESEPGAGTAIRITLPGIAPSS